VIVATTAQYAARLPALLAAAERAATVTDRFAKWGKPPGRYVVYLAGRSEWGKWYGVPQQPWVAAFAMPLTDVATEVVLNVDNVDSRDVTDVLRHELTHVVTLAGVDRTYAHSWWLVEGVAEYVRVTGGARPFDGLGDVRRYVHSGLWSGDVALDSPPAGATAGDVNGRYGVAYLAVKRLADRFGEAKMLAFFGAVVRDGMALDKAALSVLGVAWAEVRADCAAAVRARS
jgi:Peptidase of plants and bacteria